MKKNLNNKLLKLRFFLIRVFVFLCVILFAGFYVRPFRNLVLRPVWPRAWRKLTTMDVIKIARTTYLNVTDVDKCQAKVTTGITIDDVTLAHPFVEMTSKVQLKDESHRSFLPAVDDYDRREVLVLYLVVAEALEKIKVVHFAASGTLLGVARHGGFVPWDDDVDIAIPLREWERVRQALSCIEGYRLQTWRKMHWKFIRANNSTYPFIDLFFYTQNDEYVWSVTHPTADDIVFRYDDVFPLGTAKFENLQIPVPRKTVEAADDAFDLTVCQSPSLHHKSGLTKEVVVLPCSSLYYLYSMKNHE